MRLFCVKFHNKADKFDYCVWGEFVLLLYHNKAHIPVGKERRYIMDNTTTTTTICTDLVEFILDLVSQDILTNEDTASILRLAEQMIERRRAEP